jgi:uncharacterized OB-fold protein
VSESADVGTPASASEVPLVAYLNLDGEIPHLVAQECISCGALYFNRRNGCAACEETKFRPKELSNSGRLRTFSIVYRAPKSIPVPFVTAVVDLDEGGRVQANLIGVEPDPERIRVGMPVRMVVSAVGTDSYGTRAIGFGYEPMDN